MDLGVLVFTASDNNGGSRRDQLLTHCQPENRCDSRRCTKVSRRRTRMQMTITWRSHYHIYQFRDKKKEEREEEKLLSFCLVFYLWVCFPYFHNYFPSVVLPGITICTSLFAPTLELGDMVERKAISVARNLWVIVMVISFVDLQLDCSTVQRFYFFLFSFFVVAFDTPTVCWCDVIWIIHSAVRCLPECMLSIRIAAVD